MEIEEFLHEKNLLESELYTLISEAVSKFGEKTGFTPCSVRVPMIDSSTYGGKRKYYIVGPVEVDIDLWTSP